MDDIVLKVTGFWNPDEVAALSGIPNLECSTADGQVIIHPRPRALEKTEIENLQKILQSTVKPTAAERVQEWEMKDTARTARIENFRRKAPAGKVQLSDLCDVVLALIGE